MLSRDSFVTLAKFYREQFDRSLGGPAVEHIISANDPRAKDLPTFFEFEPQKAAGRSLGKVALEVPETASGYYVKILKQPRVLLSGNLYSPIRITEVIGGILNQLDRLPMYSKQHPLTMYSGRNSSSIWISIRTNPHHSGYLLMSMVPANLIKWDGSEKSWLVSAGKQEKVKKWLHAFKTRMKKEIRLGKNTKTIRFRKRFVFLDKSGKEIGNYSPDRVINTISRILSKERQEGRGVSKVGSLLRLTAPEKKNFRKWLDEMKTFASTGASLGEEESQRALELIIWPHEGIHRFISLVEAWKKETRVTQASLQFEISETSMAAEGQKPSLVIKATGVDRESALDSLAQHLQLVGLVRGASLGKKVSRKRLHKLIKTSLATDEDVELAIDIAEEIHVASPAIGRTDIVRFVSGQGKGYLFKNLSKSFPKNMAFRPIEKVSRGNGGHGYCFL